MRAKRTFAAIFLAAAAGFAGFAQPKGNVVVLQTELQNISGNAWLPNHLQSLIEENVQKYTDFSTVVDEAAERKVKEQQRRSESTAHSESDIIEIGKLVNAQYALFSSARKVGSAYTLSIDFTDLTTGVHKATKTSRQYGSLEELYARPGAVDEVTLALCERLGIALSAAERYVLEHGEADLSVSQQLELEKKEQERFRQQMEDLDVQIAALGTSTQADAETQQKKLEALHAMNEQKLKAAQERERRLLEEQKKRQADMEAEASRKEAAIQRRNSMSAEIERKVKDVRAAKVQNFNIMERVAFLETKKKTFNELQEELSNRMNEIDREADEEFKVKEAEIKARPWRAAELGDGKPTDGAMKRRSDEVQELLNQTRAQADKEKAAVEKELQPTRDALLKEIIGDYQFLENTTVTISSIKNEKDIQYSIGAFDGNTNSWPVLLYFYNDGKESIGQYQASISYYALTGKKPFAEMRGSFRDSGQEELAYNEFLDAVDMYNSLFARSEPVLTFEVDYIVEPWSVPSQYGIRFKELRVKETVKEDVLLKEEISDLNKTVSFPECQIQAECYAQIMPPTSKAVPAYLLYEFALAEEAGGDDASALNLMRRAAEKGYAPALSYFERKEEEELERQLAEDRAKLVEKERQRRDEELERQRKKVQAKTLYRSSRLGFAFGGAFSPSVQNYTVEIKRNRGASVFHFGGGGGLWARNGGVDALFAYGLIGLSIPTKRIRPYIEGGWGIGGVQMSEKAHFGSYWYGKGALELRLSPYVSLDAFFRPQGTYYTEKGEEYVDENGETKNKEKYHSIVAIAGGVGITFWKIFK
ncbi:MAG: hypothetical protein K2H09_06600 [Treponemataceae bacterium]|nr:hypothetical protein [Treponemataceae bacterium]